MTLKGSAGVVSAAILIIGWIGAAQGQPTPEENQCQSKRVAAVAKLQVCVDKVLAKIYTGKAGIDLPALIAKCHQKAASAWTKLQENVGTSCAAPRFVDNGDGTVTDNLTSLRWEKKTNDSSVHDVDNTYSWSSDDGDPTDADGTVFTDMLAALNAPTCFAGYCDWRLPNLAELASIWEPGGKEDCTSPCIDALFGMTASDFYMTSTTHVHFPFNEWPIEFANQEHVVALEKIFSLAARAVRGGVQ